MLFFRFVCVMSVSSAIVLSSTQPGVAQTPLPSIPPSKAPASGLPPAPPAAGASETSSPTTNPPAKTPSVADIERLNPSPNLLERPTEADAVKIQVNQPISLEQAQELAFRNSLDLQIAQKNLERAQFVVREAKAALFPTLTLQSGYDRQDTFILSTPESTRSPLLDLLGVQSQGADRRSVSDVLSFTANMEYSVFTFGLRSANIRAAQQLARVSQLDVERIKEALRLSVATTYYNLQDADEQVRINQAAVTNAQQSLKDTQAQERAGLGTRFDVLQSQVRLAQTQQDLTNALSTQQTRQRELAQILNLSQSANITAADPVQVAGTWDLSLEESIALSYKNRVELEQQLAQRERSEQQRRAALAAIKPQVGLAIGYDVRNNFSSEGGTGFTTGYSLGANVRWQAFDGGAARARAAQFERDKEIAEAEFARNRNDIRTSVERSFYTLKSSFENIQVATLAVTQAEEALRLARLRFQAGVGTQLEVINQEAALTSAQGSRVRAILGYNRSLAELKRNVSNLPVATSKTTTPTPITKPTAQ